MASPKSSVGIRLRRHRRMRGYSIRYAARKTGIAPIRISHWERGIRKPSYENLINLAVLYGVMVDELLFDLRQEAVKKIHGTQDNLYGEYYKKIKEKPP
jgi:transcriptional regulator with XRE-family HTH domain